MPKKRHLSLSLHPISLSLPLTFRHTTAVLRILLVGLVQNVLLFALSRHRILSGAKDEAQADSVLGVGLEALVLGRPDRSAVLLERLELPGPASHLQNEAKSAGIQVALIRRHGVT